MIKKFRKSQKGTVAILVGVMMPVMIGFIGLALDVANLVAVRTEMQNTVDAAVCGGCLKLTLPIPGGQAQAKTEANSLIASNNFSSADATLTFTQDTVRNPANAPEINCTLTNAVPTHFMQVLGIATVNLNAYAEAILESKAENYPGGPFNYTIFSNTKLTINGNEYIQGSVHSNGHLRLNGSLTITQRAEGYTGVTATGTSLTVGSLGANTTNEIKQDGNIPQFAGVQNIAMPNYTQQVLDTPGLTTYNGDQAFNGNLNISGNIYVNGNVTIGGTITDTGAILATGNITVSGKSTISGANQVFLYSSGGQITINGDDGFGSGASSVVAYAPANDGTADGTITINGTNHLNGHVIGNSITINGGDDIYGLDQGNDYPITSLTLGYHAKLID
jgi:cytoskeletal protein CcmA (bactofilin family)